MWRKNTMSVEDARGVLDVFFKHVKSVKYDWAAKDYRITIEKRINARHNVWQLVSIKPHEYSEQNILNVKSGKTFEVYVLGSIGDSESISMQYEFDEGTPEYERCHKLVEAIDNEHFTIEENNKRRFLDILLGK